MNGYTKNGYSSRFLDQCIRLFLNKKFILIPPTIEPSRCALMLASRVIYHYALQEKSYNPNHPASTFFLR